VAAALTRPLLAAALLLAAPPFSAEEPSAPPSSRSGFVWRKEANNVFGPGETFLYVVKYGFVPAGFATLEVRDVVDVNGRPAYYIMSRAKTNKATSVFFKVRDKNQSWMDVESLCSLGYEQQIREGLYRRNNYTRYDHPKGRFHYKKLRKGKETVIEGGIPAFVQDVLSSLYYVRTRPLEVGKSYSFDANSGGKTWPLSVSVHTKEKIRVPAGKFECYHIEPILAGEGIFQQQGKLEVWLTADERRMPVLLRSRVAIGAFDAELTEYSMSPDPGFLKSMEDVDKEHGD
jgi:hypothetical protein